MTEAIDRFDTATVRFAIYPEGTEGDRVVAEISEDPLRDLFGATGGGDTLVAAYHAHRATIDALALERHRQAPRLTPVLLETHDFELAGAHAN